MEKNIVFSEKPEPINIQDKMLEKFLPEIKDIFDSELKDIEEESKKKFIELFEKNGKNKELFLFEERLLATVDHFERWLVSEKRMDMSDVAKISNQIFPVISDRFMKFKNRKNNPDNLIAFTKK